MDPYRELGVGKNADAGAIKAAYRKRSRKAHPDTGGSDEEMQRVNAAYALLSSPERRARFDAGEPDPGVQDEGARLLSLIANLVIQVVVAADVKHTDIMREVRRRIEADVTAVKAARSEVEKRIRLFETAAKRVKRKSGGENMVAHLIEAEAGKMRAMVAQHTSNLETLKRMREFAEDYEYQVDPSAPEVQTITFLIR